MISLLIPMLMPVVWHLFDYLAFGIISTVRGWQQDLLKRRATHLLVRFLYWVGLSEKVEELLFETLWLRVVIISILGWYGCSSETVRVTYSTALFILLIFGILYFITLLLYVRCRWSFLFFITSSNRAFSSVARVVSSNFWLDITKYCEVLRDFVVGHSWEHFLQWKILTEGIRRLFGWSRWNLCYLYTSWAHIHIDLFSYICAAQKVFIAFIPGLKGNRQCEDCWGISEYNAGRQGLQQGFLFIGSRRIRKYCALSE